MGMEKMGGAPSQEDQSKIQGERALSDLELVKGGAQFKENGRMEATAEQVGAAKKEMEAEKKSESPEIKSLEELKTRAQEAGASPEDIKALENKLEMARDGGEAFIAKKEQEYKDVRKSEDELRKSMESGGDFDKKAENRKFRDGVISAAFGLGIMGIMGVAAYLGVNPEKITTASVAGKVIVGLTIPMVAMMGAPIARIQNWFGRKKIEEDISQVKEKKEQSFKAYTDAKFGKK